ncbi:hypothetical protein EST38_g12422 [Candolleomyces aberdarensis]|uniref:Uncharacterized protein n=1 Tax=Candolleomyces aberdarensis TaxID=2316362 RepID=A0A4Q2D2G9_9AGAR|nr:hypothetical protein EST38_g12422 [Candolleomyces aberdarensis]
MSLSYSMQCNEDRAKALVAEAKFYVKHSGGHSVRCAFFGNNCPSSQVVPVPVHEGFHTAPRPIDLVFRNYVNSSCVPGTLVYNLDDLMVAVPQWPRDAHIQSPYSYTIFKSNHPLDAPNELLRNLARPSDLRVRGNILVAKTDIWGTVQHIGSPDLFFIERMVVDDPICVKYREAPETFLIPEVMESVLAQADFPTVMAVSRVSQYGRSMAQREIRFRIRDVLVPFIEEDQFDGFMETLHALGGGIVGSHVKRLLSLKSPLVDRAYDLDPDHDYLRSKNLNLVVDNGALDKARDCLEALGYTEWCEPNVDRPYREVVKSLVVGVKYSKGDARDTLYRVTITESEAGLMQVVLASPQTCQTNLLTPTRIYSVYPRLITRRSCFKSDNPHIRPFRRHERCDRCEMNNRNWKGPCGVHCPSIQRKTVGDEGVASFLWNPNFEVPASRFKDTDYLLAESTLTWRFSIRCRNVKCKNYAPPRRRFGLV